MEVTVEVEVTEGVGEEDTEGEATRAGVGVGTVEVGEEDTEGEATAVGGMEEGEEDTEEGVEIMVVVVGVDMAAVVGVVDMVAVVGVVDMVALMGGTTPGATLEVSTGASVTMKEGVIKPKANIMVV